MSRFTQDLVLNKPDDFVHFIMEDYLAKHGFSMSDWKGEPAYRAGDAVVEGFKYLKWSYANGVFHLEAWIKGTFGKEHGLDGAYGVVVTKPYKSSLKQLFASLQQPLPQQSQAGGAQPQAGGPQGQPVGPKAGGLQEQSAGPQAGGSQGQPAGPQGQNGPIPAPIPVQVMDNYKPAVAALVVGILSIVLGIFMPLIGVILGCVGFSLARMGQGSSRASLARAGKICSIVGICLSAGIWLLNILLNILVLSL